MAAIGRVVGLLRYPVKSMRGETVDRCMITSQGMAGDRTHALIDGDTRKVASAKRPQLWRDLLAFAAKTEIARADNLPAEISITLPNGTTVSASDPRVSAVLSEAIGRSVELSAQRPLGIEIDRSHPDKVIDDGAASPVTFDTMTLAGAAPVGGFFDYAPLHLLTQSSLDKIATAVPDAQISSARYRPNIVIAGTEAAPFHENGWVGRLLQLGSEVVVRVIAPTPRCAVPTLAQPGLSQEHRALRAVADLNRAEFPGFGIQPCLGAYAEVVRPGPLQDGDVVRFLAA